MTKLKKSLSVLLSLVMLFTTLCFFVLPETGIKANARAEAQGYGSESFNPVSFTPETEIIYMDGKTSVSTKVEATVTNSSYKIRINSISAVMPYDTSASFAVAYAPGAVITSSQTFDVTGTIASTTNSVVRYTFNYDILDTSGNVVYKNLTGYTYCGVSYYDQQQGPVGDANTKPTGNLFREPITTSYANFSDSTVPNKVYVQQASASFTITMYARRGASCVGLDWCSDGDKLNAGTTSGTAPTTISYPAVAEPYIGYDLIKNQTGTFGPYTWMSWTEPASGCYSWNYNIVNSIDFSDGSGYSNHTGSVTLYYLHPNDRATAASYVELVTRGTSDNMTYYVQKNKYTTESWNNFIAAQDAAAQVAYVGQNTSSQFQTACKDNGAAPTNLYNAYLALEYADKGVAYDSIFNIHAWSNSVSSGKVNDESKGSVAVNAENGTINIKSNDGVTDLYTNFEENGKLTGNLYSTELEPNANYLLLYKVQDGSNGSYQIMVFPYNEDGSQGSFASGGFYETQDLGNAPGWRTVSFSTGATVTKATIRFGVTSANANVTFSDIHLVKIPAGENAVSYAATLKEIKYPEAVTVVNVANGKYGTLATPTRECYDFVGWFFADGTQLTGDTEIQDEGISVISRWTPKKYDFIVVDGLGKELSRTQIAYLSTVTTPSAPNANDYPGYTFEGWDYVPTTMPAHNVTVTAKWKAKSFTVTFKDGDKVISNITQEYNTPITAPDAPAKTGYDFKEWSPSVPSTMPAENTTINAVWTPKNYTITYDLSGNGVIGADVVNRVTSYTIEDTIKIPAATSTNYNFKGWQVIVNDDSNWETSYDAGATVSGAYGNITLKAVWDIKTFSVQWKNWDGSLLESDVVEYGAKPEYNRTDTPTKPADAAYSYVFKGWDQNTNIQVTEDMVFNAQYESTINSYTVTWYDADGITKLTDDEIYEYGEMPSYKGNPPVKTDPTGRLTYEFIGWTTEIVAVTGNTSYKAKYKETVNTYTVTLIYRDKDGDEKTVTINGVEHGTPFNDIIPKDDYAEFYNGNSIKFNHEHWVGSWGDVTAITKSATYTATYTLVKEVTMSYTAANKPAGCEEEGLNSRECPSCGYKYEEKIPAKEHNWQDMGNTATCLAPGKITQKCSLCSTTQEIDSDALGHTFTTTEPAVEGTCITNGSEAYKQCLRCDLYFGDKEPADSKNGKDDISDFVIEAKGHQVSSEDLTAKQPATCTEDGCEAYYTCSVCKLYLAVNADMKTAVGAENLNSFVIPKLGHNYVGVVTAPTCTKEGFTTYTCTNDKTHVYKADIVSPKGHTPGAPVSENVKGATCTEKGTYDEVVYCTVKNCVDNLPEGKEYFQISRVTKYTYLPHNYVSYEVTENTASELCAAAKTCYSYGVYYKTCSMCGRSAALATEDEKVEEKTFENVNGGKLEHKPAKAVEEDKTVATCTEPAEWDEVVYCSVEACKHKISSTHVTGEKNPENHADYTTTTRIVDDIPGTCEKPRTWTEIIKCDGCNADINEIGRTGNKNMLNHTKEADRNPVVAKEGTCISETIWRIDTYCAGCNEKTKTRTYKGEIDPTNHGEEEARIENKVEATCSVKASWDVVSYCVDCGTQTSKTPVEDKVDPSKHVGETYTMEDDDKPGTCKTAKTWDVVTYCSDCNHEIGRVAHTGDKNPLKHEDEIPELRGAKAATCGEKGYEGDLYWGCCNVLVAKGSDIPKLEQHTAGEAVKENEIPATETTDGEYDSVVYCSVCGHKMSSEHFIQKIERTIKFVLKDQTIEIKAFSGDIVEAPEAPVVQTEDGFWHYFEGWDKKIKPVTGDETYTALYTEPCDYTELETLEEQLNKLLTDGSVSEEVSEANKEEIEATLAAINRVYKDRNYRDVSEQNEITEVVDRIESLIQTICPDFGAKLVIEGSLVHYTGQTLALRAVKMPAGTEVFDADWTSSDESIVFFSNGKLYAIGTGAVTITAQRGILKASIDITVVEGGNTRGINFTSVDNTSFILEDAYQTTDGQIVFWAEDQPIRFRVHVNSSFLYEKYFVYINGEAAETDSDGYYTIPANSGDVRITIAGEIIDTGAGEGSTVTKWSFWDWLMNLFKKIGDFFRGLFS